MARHGWENFDQINLDGFSARVFDFSNVFIMGGAVWGPGGPCGAGGGGEEYECPFKTCKLLFAMDAPKMSKTTSTGSLSKS
jgi:hypothetical protein